MTKIEQLKVAYDAATPGEWGLIPPGAKDWEGETLVFGAVIPAKQRLIRAEGTSFDEACANTEFIALAHNTMPALLEVIEMVSRARNLVGEAVNVHIYDEDNGDVPDADCPYMAFLHDARSLLAKLERNHS